ncbi:MAG: PHP domain-containing protein, partial [Bacillota bacterium]|nr:PHP domain-containing protein [Bacillota bacterium]
RRPQPVVSAHGAVYQVWEIMFEPVLQQATGLSQIPGGPSLGKLMARKLTGDSWGTPTMIHLAGTNYSVPRNIPESDIPLVYLRLDQDQTGPVFRCEQVRIEQGIPFTVSDQHWSRWQPYHHQALKRKRYETQVNDTPYKLYWADTHTHSVFSPDAEGEPDEIINFGRSVAGLDIMAIVDNDFYPFFGLTTLKWQIHLALADKYTCEGAFVLFPGYEYTYHDRQLTPDFNHRYVLYPRGNGHLYKRTDAASNTIEGLMQLLEASGAMPVAHHTTWELGKSVIDRHVEVCSSWRVCKEESDFIDKRLQRGDRFSFIGSSDTHRAVPGLGGALTGIYARELTPEAIFDAYRSHRVIATQGNRTVIDLRVAGLFIGQAGSVQGDIPIHLTVLADSSIDYVSLIRDGDEIKRFTGQSTQLAVSFDDQQVEPGAHAYYVTVKLIGDPSFNAPEDVVDYRQVFFSDDKTRYPHNFARAEGPFAWCTPIWIDKTR